jgi:4-amino-4-deoxy-L-arabinose transferase-like glycosyltransferase
VVFLLALALRLALLLVQDHIIQEEGAYYARLAENLAAGRGYTSLRENGLTLIYPPLFPAAIGLLTFVGLSAETAGRLVSVVCGSALVLPIFGIAASLYDRRVALVAAVLVAVHPLLVTLSVTVFSEPLYTVLMTGGVFFVLHGRRQGRLRSFAAAGALFGLSYLTRPEAILFPLIVTALLAVELRRQRRDALVRGGALLASFAVFALPYIAFISYQTGQLRVECKTPESFWAQKKVAEGVPMDQMLFGIDRDLHETGGANMSNLEVIRSLELAPRERLRFMGRSAVRIVPSVASFLLGAGALGQPLLLGLVALGLFRTAWSRQRARQELVPAVWCACLVAPLLGIGHFYVRFALPFVPVLVLWAARGAVELGAWAADTARGLGGAARLTERMAAGASAAGVALLALVAGAGIRSSQGLDIERHGRGMQGTERAAGRWLRETQADARTVMDIGPLIAFYGGLKLVPLPYADAELALRYIDKKDVDVLVLRSATRRSRPYLGEWLDRGIPGQRAERLRTFTDSEGNSIVLYRWRRPAAAGRPP